MNASNRFFTKLLCPENAGAVLVHLHQDGKVTDYSRGEVLQRALRFGAMLARSGFTRGSVIYIVLKHGVDLYASYLGSMLYGYVPSFLPYPTIKQDPVLWSQSHREVFVRNKAECVVTEDSLLDDLQPVCDGLPIRILDMGDPGFCTDAADVPPLPAETDLALVQHSSGTTGLKKGVGLSYLSIIRQLESYSRSLGTEAGSFTVASWLPLYHDMGLISSFLLPVYLGCPIVSMDAIEWVQRPRILFELIQTYRATHCWLPNFAFQHLIRTTPKSAVYDLSSVRAFVSCSEPCKAETFAAFARRFAAFGVSESQLACCYAMAETVFAIAQSPPGLPAKTLRLDGGKTNMGDRVDECADGSLEVLSNGPPITGMTVRVLQDGVLYAEDMIGELCVSADFLFEGYINDPETTRDSFHDGFFKTGDIGFLRDSNIYVLGRIKDIVIVNGKNIYAHDIEAIVSGVPGVKPGRAVAFGVYDSVAASEKIVIMLEPDGSVQDGDVLVSCVSAAVQRQSQIAPGDIRLLAPGELVKTTSGKISRKDNRQRYLALLGQERQS